MSPPLLQNIRISTSNQGFNVSNAFNVSICRLQFVASASAQRFPKVKLLLAVARFKMTSNEENKTLSEETCAQLRERFLRTMSALVGRKCELRMHENTTVTGTFKGCDMDWTTLLLSDMNTHLGRVPQTLLRSSDVIHLTFKDVDIDSKLKEG